MPATREDDAGDRLERIERLLQELAEQLSSLREEGRVVSENMREAARASSRRSAAAKKAGKSAQTRADRIRARTVKGTRKDR